MFLVDPKHGSYMKLEEKLAMIPTLNYPISILHKALYCIYKVDCISLSAYTLPPKDTESSLFQDKLQACMRRTAPRVPPKVPGSNNDQ